MTKPLCVCGGVFVCMCVREFVRMYVCITIVIWVLSLKTITKRRIQISTPPPRYILTIWFFFFNSNSFLGPWQFLSFCSRHGAGPNEAMRLWLNTLSTKLQYCRWALQRSLWEDPLRSCDILTMFKIKAVSARTLLPQLKRMSLLSVRRGRTGAGLALTETVSPGFAVVTALGGEVAVGSSGPVSVLEGKNERRRQLTSSRHCLWP